ncbi:MAG: hypothetical protein GDA41_12055 [Rhodospirillales bacterium]|nr:hypothetical protein [Rhodospirillales bacterium]
MLGAWTRYAQADFVAGLAVDRVMRWVARHGIGKLDTPEEDSAARQGWPDETGRGWTPPWDILGIDRPGYWGAHRDRLTRRLARPLHRQHNRPQTPLSPYRSA